MDKINIGSDIRLTVHLTTKYFAPLNIHSVQAYLVNASVKSDLENQIKAAYNEYNNALEEKANRISFISRFPMEPHFCGYESSPYDICQCGYPHYHARPRCCRPAYCGFGVYPHTFDGFRNHLWAHYDMDPLRDRIKRAEELYHKNEQFLQYQAFVEETSNPSTINVYFPGSDQLKPGIYKLILVAKVYQPGYSKFSDFKTITVSYDNVFELVTEGGSDAEITVGVVPTNGYSGDGQQYEGQDLHVIGGEYDNNGHINLVLNNNTQVPPISIESETEWHEDLL